MEQEDLKRAVKERYENIAKESVAENSGCCSSTPKNKIYNIMMDDYSETNGYVKEADLSLGCGLPTKFAKINKSDTVVDLGSGAGNDCFVARHEVGSEGKVIGIDFSPEMLKKARENAEKLNYKNVEFKEGDIENIPLDEGVADVVVSNCVLNLVPNKPKVIQEIYRVLKTGGHFSISDIVLVGELPKALKQDAEMYAGCVAGAVQKSDYIQHVKDAGFEEVEILKEKPITIPDEILKKYLSEEEIEEFNGSDLGIFSITVFANKN